MEHKVFLSVTAAAVLGNQLAKGIQGAHFSTWGELDDMVERSVVVNGERGFALPKPGSELKGFPPVLELSFSEKQFRIARDALITLGSSPVRGNFPPSPDDLGGTAVVAEFYREFKLGDE